MKKIERRAVVCGILALLLAAGLGIFLVKYLLYSGDWVSSPFNRHLYDSNGVLISGREPDGKEPVTTTVTTPQKPDTLLGDVNTDSKVNAADLVLLIQYLLGNKKLSKAGAANADLHADKTVNGLDAAVLRQNLAGD